LFLFSGEKQGGTYPDEMARKAFLISGATYKLFLTDPTE
jgi:hypothetical protein